MSWSFSYTGKAAAVAAKVADQVTKIKCTEPEEAIKNTVGLAIATALAAFPDASAVEVAASGSQSVHEGKATNQLSVTIKPLWGFLE